MQDKPMRFRALPLAVFCIGSLIPTGNLSLAQQEQFEIKRRIVSKVTPKYPDLARQMRINGTVRLEVTVAPDGTGKSSKVLGGHPLLIQAATDAVSKWRWVPAPQETVEAIEIKFTPN